MREAARAGQAVSGRDRPGTAAHDDQVRRWEVLEVGRRVEEAADRGPSGREPELGAVAGDVAPRGEPQVAQPIAQAVAVERGGRPLEDGIDGPLVGLGRDASGAVLFEWSATLPVGGGGEPLPATVWTGSGERGVPRGLRLGRALLPRSGGTHVVRVEQGERAQRAESLFVRLVRPEAAP